MAHVMMSYVLHEDYPEAFICYVVSNPDYVKKWKKSQHLLHMGTRAKLLFDALDCDYVEVSQYEGTEASNGTTIGTAEHYKFLGYDVTLCIGSDNLRSISRWYMAQMLVKEFKFIVFCRKDEDMNVLPKELEHYSYNFTFKPYNYQGVSSTKVREAYIAGNLDSVKNDIPENVYVYLKSNKGVF